jgi:hypothetical protein
MERHNDRIINGLLKADIDALTTEEVDRRLATDISIVVHPSRAIPNDLWPGIWFLASALERQFTGRVLIHAGLDSMPPSPVSLGPRCELRSDDPTKSGIRILLGDIFGGVGQAIEIRGDARGNEIAYGRSLQTDATAHPISGCALAGYLAFSALAQAVGIPPFREAWVQDAASLPFAPSGNVLPPFSVLGTGQVGQAFLALAYFIAKGQRVQVHLLDKDIFEKYNQRTQILLEETAIEVWRDQPKVEYLAKLCGGWGWSVTKEQREIKWGWTNGESHSAFAFLGFDNMDARRIAVEAGFPWLLECGVGTDFCRPRISWHSLPPSRELAKAIFTDTLNNSTTSQFGATLGDGPGDCGRVIFENIQATAPSLGLLAAAMTWIEGIAHDPLPVSGRAFLWSPILPFQRDSLID